jgi:hypothetical protein
VCKDQFSWGAAPGFWEGRRAWPSRQRTNTSPINCNIASAGSPTAVRVALAGDMARTGMPTGTKGHVCDLPTLARPVRRRAAAMRLPLRRFRPDMIRAHQRTGAKTDDTYDKHIHTQPVSTACRKTDHIEDLV